MLDNATGFDRIYIACGYTDLRQGIDGLTAVIRRQLGVDEYSDASEPGVRCVRATIPVGQSQCSRQ